jgi:Helix-turn-helix domain
VGGACVSKEIDAGHQDTEARDRSDSEPNQAAEGDTVMIKHGREIIRGSGNIYRDFDLPDADVRQLKAILAAAVIKTLDRRGLSVRSAQRLTGIDAGDFSRVRNADFRRISVERLMAIINLLGSRVDVEIKLRRKQTTAKGIAA